MKIATRKVRESRPVDVPAPVSPLIGRERERGEIARLLKTRDVRLVTCTGPGGAGKTRIAIEVARDVAQAFPDGVHLIELAAVGDGATAVSEIARTLEVRETGDEPLSRLEHRLRRKRILLVLDNLEQLPGAGRLVADLLEAAPKLKVLATSRAPLMVSGEHRFELPPLGLPEPADEASRESLRRCEAIRLFAQRAGEVESAFVLEDLDDSSLDAVAAICIRLDGLPLAIELAASRTGLLHPREILDRLELGADVLRSDAVNLAERQRTLRATLDWSYELLDRDDRRLLADVSVFVGGFTLDSAEAVLGGPDLPPVLDGLQSLTEKSLLRRRAVSGPEPRFVMLETVRAYATDRLPEARAEMVRLAHARHYAGLAEEHAPSLLGRGQEQALERIDHEVENFRAALAWALRADERETALRLAAALGPFWERGPVGEGRRWLREALEGGAGVCAAHAEAQRVAGRLAALQGDYAEADALLEAAVRGFEARDDAFGVVASQPDLAWIALVRGEYERSERLWAETLARARSLGDEATIGRALTGLGRVLAEAGRHGQARSLVTEGLELRRAIGDRRGVANSLTTLGRVDLLDGRRDDARRHLEESLAMARELGDELREAEALYFLALVAFEEESADAGLELIGPRLELCERLGDALGVAECLDALGGVAALRHDGRTAARLFGSADGLRDAIGAVPWRFERSRRERHEAIARTFLDWITFENDRKEALATTFEEAAELARAATSSV